MQRIPILVLSTSLLLVSTSLAAGEPAELSTEAGGFTWHVKVPFESATLTLRGPGNLFIRQEFAPAQTLRLDPLTADGGPLRDGRYAWELNFRPVLSGPAREALHQLRRTGDDSERARLRASGLLPSGNTQVSGGFTLKDGAIQGADLEEAPSSSPEPLDDVVATDLIVQSNLCVGSINCTDGETFGSDNIKLEDNRLGILFEDTSGQGFPTHDWRILVNDGIDNFFAIEDVETSRTPFRITPNTKADAFVIAGDPDGGVSNTHVGLGTAVPEEPIHVVNGDTPALRLEQDGSQGFEAQTWDLKANELRLYFWDATAQVIPFEIRSGAPEDSFFMSESGDIGIGMDEPEDTLHIAGGLVVDGDLRISSSGKRKENIEPVAHAELLETVAALELFRWNYKTDPNKTRHLGPLAEDFYASFHLGHDERHVSPADVAGVALAAVQALQGELVLRDASMRELENALGRRDERLDELTSRLEELQRQVDARANNPAH